MELQGQGPFYGARPSTMGGKKHNPLAMLAELNYSSLAKKLNDKAFMEKYSEVVNTFDEYMNCDRTTWFKENAKPEGKGLIAYFSAEYGLSEVLPIYSGGLGITFWGSL